ncbi:voltage-gated potassium channel subunit beta-2 [Delitschia confertaspora ATCC 74209]|uniref:Voltage-gated potassium channel subunit beta-2 n=1 Tax=Delitschia confertaspora ATCC 74209 TaxID=1513339 RepID=A0A9P4JBI4_9PLEO|nr:voltage-gated potassium channel subunit beta-2 [Delitschia confertaspora ATCC 74209]
MASTNIPSDLPEMEYRFVGRSGLQVSAISLGGWLTYGGHVDDGTIPDAAHACLKAAYDAGINFFDCAEGYAGGESEKVMGRAIKKFGWKRNDIVVSTKIFWGSGNSAFSSGPRNKINQMGLSRKHIIEGTSLALSRLQLSYVDILYAHRPDPLTPMEEVVRAFNHVINQGQAFYWGTSEWSATQIEEAWGVADRLGLIGPVVEQPGFNLLQREKVEGEFEAGKLYERHGLGLTVFSPLAGGILTGKYLDGVPEDSRLKKSDDQYIQSVAATVGTDEWNKKMDAVRGLKAIAERLGTNLPALAMAWVLKNRNISSAITGASRPEQVFETVKALAVVKKLDEGVMEEIEKVMGNKPKGAMMFR